MTQVRQYAGPEGSGTYQDTIMTYDGYGRLQSQHAPEQSSGTATVWTYNPDDTTNTITDARGASQTFSYNARHLKTSITYASGGSGASASAQVSFSYDAAGNRSTMTDGLGSKTYHYNELSRLTHETRQFSVGTFGISYTYNLAGQVTGVTDPFGASFSYTRDVQGQLKAVTGSPFAGTTTYITDVLYRAWGAPKSVSYAGSNSTIAFNARLKPTEFRLTNSTGGSIMRENYSYHADARVAALTDLDDTAGSNPPVSLRFLSRAFIYDQLGRVTNGYGTGNAGQGVPFSQDYSYDAFGNMTMRAGRYYNYNFSGPITDTATYISNRRTGWSYNSDGEVTSTPLTSTDQPRTMTYDAAGRMVTSVETGAFNTTTYTASYDGDGEVAYESSTISPGTSESSYLVRSSVLEGEVLTRLDQFGNKKVTHVPADGLLFATQNAGTSGPFVLLTKRNPFGTSETTKAVYDPLGNYVPFQAHGSPQPPPGSFSSASMRGLAASQANPYSSAVGCMIDGLPTTCNRVQQAINRGEAKKLIIDARGQNPNAALATMGWFLVEHQVKPQRPSRPKRLGPSRPNPSPGNKDPFNVGSNEVTTWGFRLVAFEQPQNTLITNDPSTIDNKGSGQDCDISVSFTGDSINGMKNGGNYYLGNPGLGFTVSISKLGKGGIARIGPNKVDPKGRWVLQQLVNLTYWTVREGDTAPQVGHEPTFEDDIRPASIIRHDNKSGGWIDHPGPNLKNADGKLIIAHHSKWNILIKAMNGKKECYLGFHAEMTFSNGFFRVNWGPGLY